MKDLIERLEKCVGPDCDLDIAIFKVIQPRCTNHDALTDIQRWGWWRTFAPPYTASLDAALSLVPEGVSWVVMNKGTTGGPPSAAVGVRHDNGNTPTIALCIAALKARMAHPAKEGETR